MLIGKSSNTAIGTGWLEDGWESMKFSLLQYRGKQQESNGSISVSDVHPQ